MCPSLNQYMQSNEAFTDKRGNGEKTGMHLWIEGVDRMEKRMASFVCSMLCDTLWYTTA